MNDLEKLQQQYKEVVKQNKSLQQELCDRNGRIAALEAEIELLKNPPVPQLPFKIKSIFLPKDRLDELEEVPKLEDGKIDYWQAAKLLCEKDGGRMPSLEELGELATYLYNYPRKIGATEDIFDGLILDKDKAKPFLEKSPCKDWFSVWARTEYSTVFAYRRTFGLGTTLYGDGYRYDATRLAVCLGD